MKVKVTAGLALNACTGCGARWFIAFDGQECKPLPIDVVAYTTHSAWLHRPGVITGHCKINKTGSVNVAFNVGAVPRSAEGGPVTGNPWTGWESTMRIYIEEVEPPQQ